MFSSENPMFEVYKKMAIYCQVPSRDLDLKLFIKLKDIIKKLVVVKPEQRMTLENAREKLNELDKFTHNFLFLNPLVQNNDDPFNATDETSQNSYGLMDEVNSKQLFTISTTGNEKKLTQRTTNLCVSITAMRLLSYALVDFLKLHCNSDLTAWNDLKNSILKYPEENSNAFIRQLITICCGVISPKSLNGLNHFRRDDPYQKAAQEQNIRE